MLNNNTKLIISDNEIRTEKNQKFASFSVGLKKEKKENNAEIDSTFEALQKSKLIIRIEKYVIKNNQYKHWSKIEKIMKSVFRKSKKELPILLTGNMFNILQQYEIERIIYCLIKLRSFSTLFDEYIEKNSKKLISYSDLSKKYNKTSEIE